jgi:starvation-inducible DNA-binding protein
MALAKASLDRSIPLKEPVARKMAAHSAPTDDVPESVAQMSSALTVLLANIFALYVKTKNFHWHMSGPHFRDYQLLLDEHGNQVSAMSDEIAERAREISGTTLRSIGHIARIKWVDANDADYVTPVGMLSELWEDNLLRCVQCSWNCASAQVPSHSFQTI